ncbi:hypothetical protein TWF481_006537 [Arthrobotrys musiformis]|uniref:F-box domain-containing protein n=1 Tax=Arthrobotrys musiformis TaxID=47236 RepID=A0AAV9WAR2_9PEZI
MDTNPDGNRKRKATKKYPGLESSIYSPRAIAHGSSTPIQESTTSPDPLDHNQRILLEFEARPLEEFPFLQEPMQTLAELEKDIVAKAPPGQWFRKIPGKKTDITCLPAEMHVEILKNVSFMDQIVCERVCTTWRTIIRRDCAGFRYTTIDDSPFTGIEGTEKEEPPRAKRLRTGSKKLAQTTPKIAQTPSERPKILIHRLLQDGNFAFRQIPGTRSSVELMSTYFPEHPHAPPRRFKLANLSFLNDPIAIYTNTTFHTRHDVPSIVVEFDSEPLRNEFCLRIGGRFSTANAAQPVTPTLPLPFPSGPLLPTLFNRALSSPNARVAFSQGLQYYRPWDLGTFLLAVMGKIESPHHWYEDTALEQNERWNGRNSHEKWLTGVDYDGDWDMDNGFQKPLNISQIVTKERELLAQYQEKGFWYMREWGKDTKIDHMHVALNPVSDWVWEVCY